MKRYYKKKSKRETQFIAFTNCRYLEQDFKQGIFTGKPFVDRAKVYRLVGGKVDLSVGIAVVKSISNVKLLEKMGRRKQISIQCLWISHYFDFNEDFVGLPKLDNITCNQIVFTYDITTLDLVITLIKRFKQNNNIKYILCLVEKPSESTFKILFSKLKELKCMVGLNLFLRETYENSNLEVYQNLTTSLDSVDLDAFAEFFVFNEQSENKLVERSNNDSLVYTFDINTGSNIIFAQNILRRNNKLNAFAVFEHVYKMNNLSTRALALASKYIQYSSAKPTCELRLRFERCQSVEFDRHVERLLLFLLLKCSQKQERFVIFGGLRFFSDTPSNILLKQLWVYQQINTLTGVKNTLDLSRYLCSISDTNSWVNGLSNDLFYTCFKKLILLSGRRYLCDSFHHVLENISDERGRYSEKALKSFSLKAMEIKEAIEFTNNY